MKKTSIFLILATAIAMMFTSCHQIIGEDTTATLEDFQGNWYYQKEGKDLILNVNGPLITLEGLSENPIYFSGSVTNGQFEAGGLSGAMILTINPANFILTVRSSVIFETFKRNEIVMTKKISFEGFFPDTSVTIDKYIGTWSGKAANGKDVSITFANLESNITEMTIQNANITGLTDNTLSGVVAIIKGTANITIMNGDKTMIFSMYMSQDHKSIKVTGTGLKALSGSTFISLKKK